jgi:hypothetical protein
MTLTQIDAILPNGFHDAEIEQLVWNFQKCSAVFDIDFWVAETEQDREKRRRGKLALQGVVFISIEPPMPRLCDPKPYRCSGNLTIDGALAEENALPDLKPALPLNTEIFRFYVDNWNSFIYIAAAEATLTWLDD